MRELCPSNKAPGWLAKKILVCVMNNIAGHANFFSANKWDHPAVYRMRDLHDGKALSDEAKRQNIVFSINHPTNSGAREWELGYDFDFQGARVRGFCPLVRRHIVSYFVIISGHL